MKTTRRICGNHRRSAPAPTEGRPAPSPDPAGRSSTRRGGAAVLLAGLLAVPGGCSDLPSGVDRQEVPGPALTTSAEATELVVSPDSVPVAIEAFQQFTARDQNGVVVPGVQWTVEGVGTIDRNGIFTARSPGRSVVVASHGSLKDTAVARVFDTRAGLVGHWDMEGIETGDDTLRDRSDAGNDGRIVGASPAPGMVGEALAFDGDDHVRIPDAPSLQPRDLTLAAWVEPAGSGTRTILGKRRAGFLDSYAFRLAAGAPMLCLEPASLQTCLQATGSFVTGGEWSHLAVTWNGDTMRVYRNGVPDPTSAAHGASNEFASFPVLLGAEDQDGALANYFQGRLDDIRIYERALGESEITALYRAALQDTVRVTGKQLGDGPPGDCSGPGTLEGCQVTTRAIHPNEPADFERIAQHDLSCLPGGDGCEAPAGQWWNDGSPHLSLASGINDADVLESVARIRFPDGMPDGGEPARFDGWGPAINREAENDYREIYVSLWLKVQGTDFQNQRVGTKIFYVAYGSTERQNHSFLMLRGDGSQSVMSAMPLQAFISEMGPDGIDVRTGALPFETNVDGRLFTAGDWHQVELWMKANDIEPTTANGEIKWWLDGTLLAHHTGLRFRSDLNPRGFYHLQVTPVYGGNSDDVRTREDVWLLDDVYVSALP